MISPDVARSTYHFMEASLREDAFFLKQISSVRSAVRDFVIGVVSTIAVFVIIIGLTSYQIRNGFSPVFLIMSVSLGYLYFTTGSKLLTQILQNSKLDYNPKKEGEHFLVQRATLVKKNPPEKRLYTCKAKIQNGPAISDLVIPKLYYELLKPKEKLYLACSAEKESIVLAIPERYYQDYMKTLPMEEADYSKFQRRLTPEEEAWITDRFMEQHNQYKARYNTVYKIILAGGLAVAVLGIFLRMNHYTSPGLFVAGLMVVTLLSVWNDTRKFRKKMENREETWCMDAVVSSKTEEKNARQITFEDPKTHTVLHVSHSTEECERFQLWDKVLLVRFGKEQPVPFKKQK